MTAAKLRLSAKEKAATFKTKLQLSLKIKIWLIKVHLLVEENKKNLNYKEISV